MGPAIALIDVDEQILERMVVAATTDALADDVTAPVTPGNAWTPERIHWLRDLHRSHRGGLDGPTHEATWALVLADAPSDVLGQIRLKALEETGVYETGMWLTRSARGRGIAQLALRAVADRARASGGTTLRADTMNWNVAAQGALLRLGFVLDDADADGGIRANLALR